jgi:hypothetical protein
MRRSENHFEHHKSRLTLNQSVDIKSSNKARSYVAILTAMALVRSWPLAS